MKIALAHDWLNQMGGAENVLQLHGTPQEIAAAVGRWARGHPGIEWVRGEGFDLSLAPGGIFNEGFALSWADNVLDDAIPYGQTLLLSASGTAGLEDAKYLADRRRDIALSRTAGIDAAVGFAQRTHAEGLERAVVEADARMYEAKRASRGLSAASPGT